LLVRLAIDPDYQPLDKVPTLNLSWQKKLHTVSQERLHTAMSQLGYEPVSLNYDIQEDNNSGFTCTLSHPCLAAPIITNGTSKSMAAEKAAELAYKELQKSIIFSQDLASIKDIPDNQDPISSLNLFCQKHALQLPEYAHYYKDKHGQVALYTRMNSPWLITELKGPSQATAATAKAAVAKKAIALMHHCSQDYIAPKKLDLLSRSKIALAGNNPRDVLIQLCQHFALQEPKVETHICENETSEGLYFKTIITIASKLFGKKPVVGQRASSKPEAQDNAARKALQYMMNKILKKEIA